MLPARVVHLMSAVSVTTDGTGMTNVASGVRSACVIPDGPVGSLDDLPVSLSAALTCHRQGERGHGHG